MRPMEEDNFGGRVRRLRQQHNLSQSRLAALSNVSKISVWKWECRGVVPHFRTVQTVANILGVSERFLLTGNGAEGPSKVTTASANGDGQSSLDQILADCKARVAEQLGVNSDRVAIIVKF